MLTRISSSNEGSRESPSTAAYSNISRNVGTAAQKRRTRSSLCHLNAWLRQSSLLSGVRPLTVRLAIEYKGSATNSALYSRKDIQSLDDSDRILNSKRVGRVLSGRSIKLCNPSSESCLGIVHATKSARFLLSPMNKLCSASVS